MPDGQDYHVIGISQTLGSENRPEQISGLDILNLFAE